MELMESAHQIPVSPREVRHRIHAYGILAPVRVILTTLHRRVFPRPDSAPTVMLSMHMKASQSPTIRRYPADTRIASASWKKIPEICSGNRRNIAVTKSPQLPRRRNAISYPFRILSRCRAP